MGTGIEFSAEQIRQSESPFLFVKPDEINALITPEMRAWLHRATIVHIAPPWLPIPHEQRNYGGIENVMDAHIAALADAGVGHQIVIGHPGNKSLEEKYQGNVTTVFPKFDLPEGVEPDVDLLKLLRTEPAKARAYETAYLRSAYNWIRTYARENTGKVSVIHDHTNLGMRYGSFFNNNIPVVVTEHNALVQPFASAQAQQELERYVGLRRLGFVAISGSQRRQMEDLNWLRVVHNGVDLNNFDYVDKSLMMTEFPRQEPYLLYLGRVTPDKGVHNAIKIAQALHMKLVVAGAVEETPEAQAYYVDQLAQPIVHGDVIHYQHGVNGEVKRRLLAHASCFLMPIEWPEPLGMVMLEALASGTPVVGMDIGAVREVVGRETGFVVPFKRDNNNNVILDAVIEAVRRVLDGEISSASCREWVERHFSNAVMTANYIKAYMQQEQAA